MVDLAVRWWALLLALQFLVACGGLTWPPDTWVDGGRRPGADDPWRIPGDSFPTQRLYRVRYAGPEGRAGFKLTLYLPTAAAYRMAAADSLGRKLWSLQVEESGRAVWLDHRSKEFCEARGAEQLLLVPLAHLPLAALPRLLLGRMPAEPVANLVRAADQVSYLDARGQRWSGVLRDGELAWWSLEEDGEAVAWWRRDGDGGSFADPRASLEVRWQETVREALRQPLAELQIPPRFREGACGRTAS